MRGIQPSALTDDEFNNLISALIGNTGALPEEALKELLHRTEHGGRDEEKRAAANNPAQLNLPFNE